MRNAIVVTCQLTLNTSAAAVRNLGKLPGKGGGGGGGYEYEYDATYDDDMYVYDGDATDECEYEFSIDKMLCKSYIIQ